MRAFLTALQFLTIIPIRTNAYPEVKTQAQSFLYYPMIGLIIGITLWLVLQMCQSTHLSSELIAAIILTFWVVITGALHLDGLADFFDGLMGGLGDKEKMLRIMRDSHIGAIGCIALILLLLLKWTALLQLISHSTSAWFLILAPFIARTSVLALFLFNTYIRRTDGIASQFHSEFNIKQLKLVLVGSVVLLASYSMVALLSVMIAFYLFNRLFVRTLKGFTGDCCGAMIEMMELIALIVLL